MGGFGGFDDYDLSNGSRNAIVIVCPKSTCLIICVKRQKLKSESGESRSPASPLRRKVNWRGGAKATSLDAGWGENGGVDVVPVKGEREGRSATTRQGHSRRTRRRRAPRRKRHEHQQQQGSESRKQQTKSLVARRLHAATEAARCGGGGEEGRRPGWSCT